MMSDVLYVDKPVGMTSFDVCYKLRKVLNTRKIGHTGTLDPNASGVMVVLYDKATKANQFLVSARKSYECRILLGVSTDTLDIDGQIIEEKPYTVPDKKTLTNVLDSFKGSGRQEVPLTSAVKVAGKRLYEYQREGKEIQVPVRDIEVLDISLMEMFADGFSFSCRVSSGTYIRALVRDILAKLELIGTVKDLRRTAIDNIDISQCDKLEDIEKGNYHLHDLKQLLQEYYPLVEYEKAEDIRNGKMIKADCDAERIVIVNNGEVLAVYERAADHYKCLRGLW